MREKIIRNIVHSLQSLFFPNIKADKLNQMFSSKEKKRIIPFLFLMSVFGLCTCLMPEKLTIPLRDIQPGKLKLNGYYYGISGSGHESYFFLYSNGVVLKGISRVDYNDNEYFKSRVSIPSYIYEVEYRKNITHLGVYIVNRDNSIIIEHWEPAAMPPITRLEGKILNDSTIYFFKSFNSRWDKTETIGKLYFHFIAYSPKPDSTNDYTSNPKYHMFGKL